MKAKKILTFLPVFVFIATYGFAKPVKQQYKDEKVEVNISFSIPGKWKKQIKMLSKEDKKTLLSFITTYKEEFDPSIIKKQVDEQLNEVSQYLNLLGKSQTIKEFLYDYVLPSRNNVSNSIRYYGGNELFFEFLSKLEKIFLQE